MQKATVGLAGLCSRSRTRRLSVGLLGRDGDLDHVGVLLAHACVDLLQVGRHLAQVVVADDALDVAEAADGVGDVGFEIDPVEAADDGLAQQHLAGLLGAAPAAAVCWPAHRGHQRAGLVGQQALEVGGLGQEVEAQLDQPGAALGRLLDLDLDHLVPGPADDHADSIHIQAHAILPALRHSGTRLQFLIGGRVPDHADTLDIL